MTKFGKILPFIALCALSTLVLPGCEDFETDETASWHNPKAKPEPEPEPTPEQPESPTEQFPPGTGEDEVDYAAMQWLYGDGFNGSKAVKTGTQLSNLWFSNNHARWTWDINMSAWGFPQSSHMEYCAMFVRRKDGAWVGGKFDWVSSAHTAHVLHHIYPPGQDINYRNWKTFDWSSVPNPAEAAFVVVTADGKRRSNIIKGSWAR